MRGKSEAKRARQEAERSAQEARELRAAAEAKEKMERDKIQRKLIRGIKGRMNPFEFLPGEPTLGGTNKDSANG